MNDVAEVRASISADLSGVNSTNVSSPRSPVCATDIAAALCCPRCHSDLVAGSDRWTCANDACLYANLGFPVAAAQPVLVDFEHSIFDRASYTDGRGSVLPRDDTGQGLRTRMRRALFGGNPVAAGACQILLTRLRAQTSQPLILIIGGGAVGLGTEAMYSSPDVRIVGTDVYASRFTTLLADGHCLPFRDGTFDAVWIEAVLEHVLDPQTVADEIHRVLKPDGLVYADTPFMQQVHEGPYDFTRFTQSGHRWLFRRFVEIDAGPVGGAGTSLLWSIRYFTRSFGANKYIIFLTAMPFFWVRLLERFANRKLTSDAASGTYFFGIRSGTALTPRQMVDYYRDRKT